MASSDQKPDVEATKPAAPRPPPPPPGAANYFAIDVGLRVLLFAATLVALVVMVTSKQTELAALPGGFRLFLTAKFNHSPALIYFVVAMSVACLYSIFTMLASLGVISKPAYAAKFLLPFAFLDVVMLGIVASATGAAAAVAYIGLRGNSHVGWNKVCPVYDKFCRHIGSSVAISLFASILLVFLTLLSVFSLHRRIPE